MKDNWIKPFQDRLGEYELDLPQAAARPRKRIILPLLSAAAAAAILLLVFLPSPSSRRSTPGDVRRDGRLKYRPRFQWKCRNALLRQLCR